MKPIAFCTILFSLVLLSFTIDKKTMLIRKWRAAKMQSPQVDSVYKANVIYIDTLGKHSDAATNLEMYGTTNMDSIRHLLRHELDSTMAEKMRSVKNTIFNFRKDSILVLSFGGQEDSCKWHFDTKGRLVFTAIDGEDDGSNMDMEVLTLTETEMKLKFTEDGSYSIVTFYPDKIKAHGSK